MGNAADDRLTEQELAKLLGGSFRFASTETSTALEKLTVEADALRGEGMDQKTALLILSGKTRQPYGTARSRKITD